MLKIGTKKFKLKKLNAHFPIKFYKETGIDVFSMDKFLESGRLIDMYDATLNLAYQLVEYEGTFDEFVEEVTYQEVLASVEDIMTAFNSNSKAKSKSADKSKK